LLLFNCAEQNDSVTCQPAIVTVTLSCEHCYKPDSHALLDVSRSNLITEIHHKLGKLLDIDDVLGIIGVCVDDLCTACHLQRLFTWTERQQ